VTVPDTPEKSSRLIQSPADKTVERSFVEYRESRFTGPLPHPQLFEQYERVLPGAADRIFAMAESEAHHRRAMEEKAINADIEGMRRQFAEGRVGQFCALVITIGFIVSGTYVALRGQPLAGVALSGIGITTIVSTFIWGRTRKEENKPPQPETKPHQAPKKSKR
jgi:uncharacterized membrane protein